MGGAFTSRKHRVYSVSDAYTTEDIKYEWKATNPVQQKDGLRQSLPSFELQDVVTKYCTSKTNTGEYSCLRTQMVLRREFSYYLLQLYIPSFMLVIVSWVSFWLDKDSVPARVTLGMMYNCRSACIYMRTTAGEN
ncbi:unnamed protein product [Strongylus vulgaris]|uniref:Neurotransmitter-gated ion-channel transmembrane domain-containing protein n=1 Tax=Strongylus vulgaris TaxID=40348 RepID=A0A3P7KNR4_STRVU|nr:unnamed protein product [Strongylus vulgaris]